MTTVYEEECVAAGVDPRKVRKIANRIRMAVRDAQAMGLFVFGGSGSGSLRWRGDDDQDRNEGRIVVAELGDGFDGGDGATHVGSNGLLRGEDGR